MGDPGMDAAREVVDIPVLGPCLTSMHASVKRLTAECIAAITEDGAHAIVFGCTGMLGWADDIQAALVGAGYPGVPVVDPIPLTVRTAAALVGSGLTHSKRTYPTPPAKARPGWDTW